MSHYSPHAQPMSSPYGQPTLVEQRTRSIVGSIIQVSFLLGEALLVPLSLLTLFASISRHAHVRVFHLLYFLWTLACFTTISVLVIMGLRRNVAQRTYRLCGAVILLYTVVEYFISLLFVIAHQTGMSSGFENMLGWARSIGVLIGVFVALPLFLPMRSKTLGFLRPISITMVSAPMMTHLPSPYAPVTAPQSPYQYSSTPIPKEVEQHREK